MKKAFIYPGWLLLFAICAGVFPFGLNAQSNAEVTQEDIVFMPKLEVVERRQRNWRYTRTDRIELLTDMSNTATAVAMAQALDMAVERAEFIFPNAERLREIPIKIVLYEDYERKPDNMTYAQIVRNRGKWRHLTDPEQYMVVRPYTKDIFGTMHDNHLNGIWVGSALFGGTRNIIVRPLNEWGTHRAYAENLYLDCVYRASWISDQNRFDDGGRNHEVWISFMARNLFDTFDTYHNGQAPAYDRSKPPPLRVKHDQVMDGSAGLEFEFNHIPAKLRWELGPYIPLGEILTQPPPRSPRGPGSIRLIRKLGAKEPDSVVYDDPNGPVATKWIIWQRECRDFGYYCLVAKRDECRGAWMRFVHAIGQQTPTEELFKECFGKGFEAFHKEMYEYCMQLPDSQKKWGWGPLNYTFDVYKNRPKPAKPALRPATRAETSRILSEAMVFGGSDSPEYAHNVLLKAAREAPQSLEDPEFAASLGLGEANHGNRDRAIELLEKATAAKVARASAYRTLAQLRLEKLLAEKGNASPAKLTAQEAASVLDPLLLAHGQRQATGQAYKQMAELWNHTDCDPPVIVFDLIAAGCVYFATELDLLEAAVPLLAKYQKRDMISAIMERTAKWMFSESDKQRHKKLTQQYGLRPNG